VGLLASVRSLFSRLAFLTLCSLLAEPPHLARHLVTKNWVHESVEAHQVVGPKLYFLSSAHSSPGPGREGVLHQIALKLPKISGRCYRQMCPEQIVK
jgi:hypothetical protein